MALAKVFMKLFDKKKDLNIQIVGLEGAGKTTILHKMKLGQVATTSPAVGLEVEAVKCKNISFTAWDANGQGKISTMREQQHFANTVGIIFVLDVNDREGVTKAKEELHNLLPGHVLEDAFLLILANKSDLPNAMNASEVTDKLELHSLRQRGWYIQQTCATNGDGLYEGMEWLTNNLEKSL